MKLFYRQYGEGQPLIILHGLFGQADNWNTLAKQFAAQGFDVYAVDQRNHGLSPHSEIWNYKAMSSDVLELIKDHELRNVVLLGHSMGGKTAMQFAVEHPGYLDKLIVVDIAPKYYPIHHQLVLDALHAVDFNVVKSRKEAEAILSQYIEDFGTKQFLLKNIFWTEDDEMAWRFNLDVITKEIENVGKEVEVVGDAPSTDIVSEVPALFIRGEHSHYILDTDLDLIQEIFPHSILETIKGSGHWVHAEKPKEFFDCVMKFIGRR
ncbi:MAG: alpha/beta fold hydrolase [Bacteroidia bacterium]